MTIPATAFLMTVVIAATLFIQGTRSDDPYLTCANCPQRTRDKITEVCAEDDLREVVSVDDCDEPLDNDDAWFVSNVCEPIGVCGDAFVSCTTCITKVREVAGTLCDSLTGATSITIVSVTIELPYSDTCNSLLDNSPDSKFDFICALGNGIVDGDGWGYDTCNGPSTWGTAYGYTECARTDNQSPVDLDSALAPASVMTFSDDYRNVALPGTVTNNGRTALFTFDGTPTATVSGLIVDFNTFTPAEIKLRWGATNTKGSEHKIDGQTYAMEMQVTHRNTDYATLEDATAESDGIMIMSFLFQVVSDWSHIDIFKTEIEEIGAAGNQFARKRTSSIDLNAFLTAVDINGFFKYKGSLTEPECNEDVTWIVFDKVLGIRQEQLDAVRKLKNLDWVLNTSNYRFTQPANNRVVERYEA